VINHNYGQLNAHGGLGDEVRNRTPYSFSRHCETPAIGTVNFISQKEHDLTGQSFSSLFLISQGDAFAR
jgi:hypothetical protein